MNHLKSNPLQQLLEVTCNANGIFVSKWDRNQSSRPGIELQVFLDHIGDEEWMVIIID